MDMDPLYTLTVATLLATANERLVEFLLKPVKQRFPNIDLWWAPYLVFATGAAIGWFAKINLLADVLPDNMLGLILTAAFIAGGSEMVHSIFGAANAKRQAARDEAEYWAKY